MSVEHGTCKLQIMDAAKTQLGLCILGKQYESRALPTYVCSTYGACIRAPMSYAVLNSATPLASDRALAKS